MFQVGINSSQVQMYKIMADIKFQTEKSSPSLCSCPETSASPESSTYGSLKILQALKFYNFIKIHLEIEEKMIFFHECSRCMKKSVENVFSIMPKVRFWQRHIAFINTHTLSTRPPDLLLVYNLFSHSLATDVLHHFSKSSLVSLSIWIMISRISVDSRCSELRKIFKNHTHHFSSEMFSSIPLKNSKM